MSVHRHIVEKLAPEHELGAFDCGEQTYNEWVRRYAASSVRAGVSAVYVLVETDGATRRVVGYYAINPTQVLRADAPASFSRGWPGAVPAWRLGKLAIHLDLRSDKEAQWGSQLLRHALRTIIRAADVGGGKVIVVDADNPGLIEFYVRNGFRRASERRLSLYLKLSTARKELTAS